MVERDPSGGEPAPPSLTVLLQRQAAGWQRGERPSVEDLLGQLATRIGATDLLALVVREWELREARGETPCLDEYLHRFPDHAELLRQQFEMHATLRAARSFSTLPPPLPQDAPAVDRDEAEAEAVLEQVVREWESCEARAETPCLDEYVRRFPRHARLIRQQYEVHDFTRGAADAGLEVPGYEILGVLGRGGMGVVYKARHLRLDRLVALKMLLNADPEAMTRFRSEAETVARLGHPNVVGVHDVGDTADGRLYCAFEHVSGGSLAQKLAGTPLQPRDAATLVQAVARGVHAAHERDVIHRDLKPANVLLAEDGTPKVADFGLAKRLDADAGVTREGDVFGTPSYMAPEQAAGRLAAIGPQTDVWALGAILYECLTGRPPFRAANQLDTLFQVMNNEPVTPRQLAPQTPRDLETICLKCLRKRPEQRYSTAAEVADDLQRFLDGVPIRARPISVVERAVKWVRRRPTAAALAAVSVLAVVILAGAELWHRAEQDRTRAEGVVVALLGADTAEVPGHVQSLAGLYGYARPLLQARLATPTAPPRERLHAALALLPTDETQVDFLRRWLPNATPAEVRVLRRALLPYREHLTPELWASLKDPGTPEAQRLPLAAALAEFDPTSASWTAVTSALVKQLNAQQPLPLDQWLDALDRPEIAVEVLLSADAKRYAGLLPKVQAHRAAALPLLRQVFERGAEHNWEWADPTPDPARPEPGADVRRQLEAADGMLTERFAFCQTLPLDDLEALDAGLRGCGYRLLKLRPFLDGGGVRAAAVWARDGGEARWQPGLTAAEMLQRDEAMRAQDYRLVDTAGYLNLEGAERYAVVWQRGKVEGTLVPNAGITEADIPKILGPLRQAGLVPLATQGFRAADGLPRYTVVYASTPVIWTARAGNARDDAVVSRMPDLGGSFATEAEAETLDRPKFNRTLADAAVVPRPEHLGGNAMPPVWYTAIWHGTATREARVLHGLDPRTLTERAWDLAAQGYRPVSISVCSPQPGAKLTAVSVWQRPLVTDAAHASVARRRAVAATTLLRLGESGPVWPMLQHRADPTDRSWLIHSAAPCGIDPADLMDRYGRESNVSAKRALLLALGEYDVQALPAARLPAMIADLLRDYRDDPDAGLHGAIDWLLRQRWGQATALNAIVADLQKKAREEAWPPAKPAETPSRLVSRNGQAFTVVPAPAEFSMGAPLAEPGRRQVETLHRQRINRSFAIATRPVTVAEFDRFLKANPAIMHAISGKYAPDPNCPIISVTWFEAAAYCRWLSEVEGVAPDQMCFPAIKDITDGMRVPKDYLKLTGYRLPTEAEWEYACRAAAVTSRHYGRGDELLTHYAWYSGNSETRTWPVGSKKPNDLGLFDMHGNVWQWTYDATFLYNIDPDGKPTADGEMLRPIEERQDRILRGGSFVVTPPEVRSAFRFSNPPGQGKAYAGFRVVRTLP